ncbi:hypothetical protein ARC20_02555 [Stenotrophomonas panacihumi]|uniref:Uncharacterized protein n=2 Tax=Stenotrophomonas panacihumi TaxID=676599 RepID=A0A0R0B613_9GAMM|nr:hypothetical protein ARC20_02555 [Stenotrophomonas panacihumi]PTN53122.1 hypothetical protein C9J98_17315 [Stenotrophomonas panacihumi]
MTLVGVAPVSAADNILKVGPVQVGDSEAQVRSALGKPLRSSRHEGFITRVLHYPGIDVGFDDADLGEVGTVAAIEATGPRYCFDGWLCPGMSYAEAKTLARSRGGTVEHDGITVYGDSCWIVVSQARGRVSAVEMRCQP